MDALDQRNALIIELSEILSKPGEPIELMDRIVDWHLARLAPPAEPLVVEQPEAVAWDVAVAASMVAGHTTGAPAPAPHVEQPEPRRTCICGRVEDGRSFHTVVCDSRPLEVVGREAPLDGLKVPTAWLTNPPAPQVEQSEPDLGVWTHLSPEDRVVRALLAITDAEGIERSPAMAWIWDVLNVAHGCKPMPIFRPASGSPREREEPACTCTTHRDDMHYAYCDKSIPRPVPGETP